MGNVHQTELWHDMLVVLGTFAAALVGLLFIVTSLHLSRIINDPILHDRAFNNTCYLLIILIETLVMLMPQPLLVAGAEIVLLNLVGLFLLLRIPLRIVKNKKNYRRSGGHIHRLLYLSHRIVSRPRRRDRPHEATRLGYISGDGFVNYPTHHGRLRRVVDDGGDWQNGKVN